MTERSGARTDKAKVCDSAFSSILNVPEHIPWRLVGFQDIDLGMVLLLMLETGIPSTGRAHSPTF